MESLEQRPPGPPAIFGDRIDSIVANYLAELEAIESPLGLPDIADSVAEQARTILCGIGEKRTAAAVELSRWIGDTRVPARVHPVDAMRAAAVLFETALPAVHEALRESGDIDGYAAVVTELHGAIYASMSDTAVPYVNFLLQQVYESHHHERRRIARELHDGIAHTIAVGIQQLDLRTIDLSRRDDESADRRLETLRGSLVEALIIVRELGGDLRRYPTCDGLDIALYRYVDTVAAQGIDISLSVDGDLESIALDIREELYFVTREAIRNAVTHSHSAEILAHIGMSDGVFEATIEDFGNGFDTEQKVDDGGRIGIGLTSMRERMEILGGTLKIVSTPGLGTRVTASVRL
ncbi:MULTISPECIES: sensor histidine kinase [unclassified Nocardia]|uniref:sensor histidine kinase n=1 Tax=unclassified Nocardia TaxID=2637762 RepID=UPI001CE42A9F|nr:MULTISPECIES: histidine kinase [unclassified Nocardia]